MDQVKAQAKPTKDNHFFQGLTNKKLNIKSTNVEISKTIHNQGNVGTCYAYACASVIHSAIQRSLGNKSLKQEENSEETQDIVLHLISQLGFNGASIENALKEYEDKRLVYLKVKEDEVKEILLKQKRPIIASFSLTNQQWSIFSNFFQQKKEGIFTKDYLQKEIKQGSFQNTPDKDAIQAHAIALIGICKDSSYFKAKNSWGKLFGDEGEFRFSIKAMHFNVFYDVKFKGE